MVNACIVAVAGEISVTSIDNRTTVGTIHVILLLMLVVKEV